MTRPASWAGVFYTHFLGRDLAYLTGGGLFITIVIYAYRLQLVFPTRFSVAVVAYALGSYFVGFMLSEFGEAVGIVSKRCKVSAPEWYTGETPHPTVMHAWLVRYYPKSVLALAERTVFVLHVGASVGVAAFLSAVVLFVAATVRGLLDLPLPTGNDYAFITGGLAVFGSFGIWHARWVAEEMRNETQGLIDGLPETTENI